MVWQGKTQKKANNGKTVARLTYFVRIKGLERRAERGEAGIPLKINTFYSRNHYLIFLISSKGEQATRLRFLCGRESACTLTDTKKANNGKTVARLTYFVRIKGLEPPRLSASDPKSDVATNYTISAGIAFRPLRALIAMQR